MTIREPGKDQEHAVVAQGEIGDALRNLRDVRYWLENGLVDVSGAEIDHKTGAHVIAHREGLLLRKLGYLSVFPPYQQHKSTGSLPRSNVTFSYTVLQPHGHQGEAGAFDVYSARAGVFVLATAPERLTLESILDRESWIGRAASQNLVTIVNESKNASESLEPQMLELLVQAAHNAHSTALKHHVGQYYR